MRPIRLLFLAFLAVPALAQQQQQTPPFSEQVNVRIVTVPVIAREANGQPVKDLEAAEVSVREQGRAHAVESVTPVMRPPVTRADLPRVRLITQAGGPKDVATSKATEPRYMVILIDIENDPPTARDKALEATAKFVETDLDPSFQVALLVLDGELQQRVPFTQNRQLIVSALKEIPSKLRARARMAPELRMESLLRQLPECVAMDGVMSDDCIRGAALEHAGELHGNALMYIAGLEGAVDYLSGLEGHKSVLVVGGNITFSPAGPIAEAIRALFGAIPVATDVEQDIIGDDRARPRLEEVLTKARRNNVSFSFLDRSQAPSDVSPRRDTQFQPGYRPMTRNYHAGQEDLNEIAAATGGTFVASTRVDEGLRRTVALMEGAYYVSFYLRDDKPLTPKRLRGIKITSVKRPGVEIRHRRGFEDWRSADDTPAATVDGLVETGARVKQEIDGAPADVTPIRFTFEPKDLGYEEKGDQAVAQFTVHIRLRTNEGDLLADSYRVLHHSYPIELWRKGEVEPPALMAFADLPEGDYVAEAVVSVPRLGRQGTLRRQFSTRVVAAAKVDEAAPRTDAPAPAAPAAAAGTPAPLGGAKRPLIGFAQHFLGLVAGRIDVGLVSGSPEVAAVDIVLDGRKVATLKQKPWSISLQLGEAPEPHHLLAVARDASGRELGRVQQPLNLPRPWAEMDVVISDQTAQLTFQAVGGEQPTEITATLDGNPIPVSESRTISLAGVDMSQVHFLRVDAKFGTAGAASRDLVFGGQHIDEANTELTSVAVQVRKGDELKARDAQMLVNGQPAPVVAIEKGLADLIVVIDPRALDKLPGRGPMAGPRMRNPVAVDTAGTPGEAGVQIRLIWPVAQGGEKDRAGYRLFPSTAPDATPLARGLLWHLSGAALPSAEGSVRLADAVAVAGSIAIERGRRRAVLLIHGGSPSEGEYSAAAARQYLETLRVPLIVWTTARETREMAADWGSMEPVVALQSMRILWSDLMRQLDRQRVVWVSGTHLPQSIDVAGTNLSLAGVRR